MRQVQKWSLYIVTQKNPKELFVEFLQNTFLQLEIGAPGKKKWIQGWIYNYDDRIDKWLASGERKIIQMEIFKIM